MPLRAQQHWIDHVRLALYVLNVGPLWLLVKACENAGEVHDVLVAVGWDGLPVRAEHLGAVRVELPQADGKELHDLTGVVFIREEPITVEGTVPLVGEVVAHDWAVGHFSQHVAEVAEGMPDENVIVVNVHLSMVGRGVIRRNDEDLCQRPCHPLPELVRGLQRKHRPNGGTSQVWHLLRRVVVDAEGRVHSVLWCVECVLVAEAGIIGDLSWRATNLSESAETLNSSEG
mmetsp:Transcript_44420/g.103655  ORF Transcript_44420/g.103655 Transcript_44420/m.103655 type:complete len:230 (+) Transcript_44420:2728-3417(+)